jgi:hypothetical protein
MAGITTPASSAAAMTGAVARKRALDLLFL